MQGTGLILVFIIRHVSVRVGGENEGRKGDGVFHVVPADTAADDGVCWVFRGGCFSLRRWSVSLTGKHRTATSSRQGSEPIR